MKIGRPEHFRWLFGIVAAVLVLNLVDAVFTMVWYFQEQASEANPFMDTLLSAGALPFVLGKTALVCGGSYLLWRRRYHAFSVIGIVALFLVYYFVLLYHLQAADFQLFRKLFG